MLTKIKSIILSIFLFNLGLNLSYAQQIYYWSNNQKNYLTADSSTILVNIKAESTKQLVINKIKVEKLKPQAEISWGGGKSLIISNLYKNYKSLKTSLAQDLAQADYILPVFQTTAQSPLYFTNQIVLQPKQNVKINQILKHYPNLTLLESSAYNTFLLEVKQIDDLFKIANQIHESGQVEWCHPNFIAETKLYGDPLYSQQYYLNNTGQTGGTAGIDINAPEAWCFTYGSGNIKVAVVDDGVAEHEDLGNRILSGFTAGASPYSIGNGYPDNDCYTHGLAGAGIIAASHNDIGVKGIAPNVKIVPINIFFSVIGTGSQGRTANDVANAINWAWNQGQADVLNCAFGWETAPVIAQAITSARTSGRGGKGSVVIAASGNNNPQSIGFPANLEGVLTVGAIDKNGNLWNYSQRGPEMDLVAPAGNVASCGDGQENFSPPYYLCRVGEGDVVTTDRMGGYGYNTGYYTNDGGNYTNGTDMTGCGAGSVQLRPIGFGGTSAACPQVSGVAALLLSINPNLTEAQVRSILQSTATDMGTSGFDNNFGYGRLNAEAAVRQVITMMNSNITTSNNVICIPSNPNTSTATFTLNNAPQNVPINWVVSSNLTIISGQGTSQLSVRGNNNGQGTVSVQLGSCGNFTVPFNSGLSVGVPSPTITQVNAAPYPNGPTDVRATVPNASTILSHKWYIDGNLVSSQSGAPESVVTLAGGGGCGSHFIYLQITNTCGSTNSFSFLYNRTCGGGGGGFGTLVSPNPSNGQELSVVVVANEDISSQSSANQVADNEVIPINDAVKLLNNLQRPVWEGKLKNGKVKIPTNNIPNGIYYLRIEGEKPIVKQIIIQH